MRSVVWTSLATRELPISIRSKPNKRRAAKSGVAQNDGPGAIATNQGANDIEEDRLGGAIAAHLASIRSLTKVAEVVVTNCT